MQDIWQPERSIIVHPEILWILRARRWCLVRLRVCVQILWHTKKSIRNGLYKRKKERKENVAKRRHTLQVSESINICQIDAKLHSRKICNGKWHTKLYSGKIRNGKSLQTATYQFRRLPESRNEERRRVPKVFHYYGQVHEEDDFALLVACSRVETERAVDVNWGKRKRDWVVAERKKRVVSVHGDFEGW